MEVCLIVPKNTDLSFVKAEYPDLYEDEGWEDSEHWWIGSDDDDDGGWMEYEEGVAFCGFCEGAIPDAYASFPDDGGWATGMIRRRDFSGLAISDESKAECKRISDLYWAAFERGRTALEEK